MITTEENRIVAYAVSKERFCKMMDEEKKTNQNSKKIDNNENKGTERILRLVRAMFLSLALGIVVVSYLLFNHDPEKILGMERRKVTKTPNPVAEDGTLNNDFFSDIYKWFGDNLGLRETYSKRARQVNKYIFKNRKMYGAEIGTDGWLYGSMDENMKIAYGTYPFSDKQLKKFVDQQEKMDKWCRDRGIKYVLCVVPAKTAIYPENITNRRCEVRETPCDRVYNALKGKINVVDLKTPMLNERDQHQMFLKLNTHWTCDGAYLGYSEILKAINRINEGNAVEEIQPVSVHREKKLFAGDLVIYAGLVGEMDAAEEADDLIFDNPTAVAVEPPKDDLDNSYYENPAGKGGYVMVLGDSYSGAADYHFMNYFAETFNRTRYIADNHSADFEKIEKEHPDYLVLQLSERELSHSYDGLVPKE